MYEHRVHSARYELQYARKAPLPLSWAEVLLCIHAATREFSRLVNDRKRMKTLEISRELSKFARKRIEKDEVLAHHTRIQPSRRGGRTA